MSPDVYIDLIVPQIRTGGGGAIQFLIGALKVLSNLLKGSTIAGSLKIEQISRIVEVISSDEIISNENLLFRTEMANVLNSLLGVEKGVFVIDHPVSYSLFYILVHLRSAEGDGTIVGYADVLEQVSIEIVIYQVQNNFSLFLTHLEVETLEVLTAVYFDTIMLEFKNTVCNWTKYSPQLRLFSTIAIQSGPFVGERLELFITLCSELAKPDLDYDIKNRYC